MLARLTLIVREKKALALPMDALLRFPATGVYYAFVVRNGIAYKVSDLKLGIREGNRVEIAQGLKEGDSVVFSGHGRLQSGQAVKIVPAE